MSDLEASKLAAIQAHAGVRHSDTYMLEAFRQIGEKALYLQSFLLDINGLAARDVFARGLQFIATRATEALQPVTIADPPDNGCITSPGEMAGNPSSAEYNDFHTRHAGS